MAPTVANDPDDVSRSQSFFVPSNAMYGFWYCRYRYNRSTDGVTVPSDVVGHPITANDATLWQNMRDFMADASVTWKRDKLPRVTNMSVSVPNYIPATNDEVMSPEYYKSNVNGGVIQPEVTASLGPMAPLFRYANGEGVDPYPSGPLKRLNSQALFDTRLTDKINTAGAPIEGPASAYGWPTTTTYEVSYSNMPVRWTVKYSARKHLMDTNLYRNGIWQPLTPPANIERLPGDKAFYVKFGYVAFDATGKLCFTVPIDRIALRQVEAEIQYFITLRDPLVEPWRKPTNVEYPGLPSSLTARELDPMVTKDFLANPYDETKDNVFDNYDTDNELMTSDEELEDTDDDDDYPQIVVEEPTTKD